MSHCTTFRGSSSTWTFDVSGLVDRPLALTYAELLELPRKVVQCDIHCVTRWSRLDNTFEGVAVQLLLEHAGVKPDAQYCLVSPEQGFTTNLPLTDLDRPDNLVAFKWNGEWLMPEHGGPARLLGAERLPHAGRSVAGRAVWGTGAHPTRYQSAAESQQEARLREIYARTSSADDPGSAGRTTP